MEIVKFKPCFLVYVFMCVYFGWYNDIFFYITAVVLHVRKIVEVALSVGAVSVVLAHNHPAGYALPSADDSDMTIRVAKALKDVDVELIDHIIFADSDFTSCMATNFQCSDFG